MIRAIVIPELYDAAERAYLRAQGTGDRADWESCARLCESYARQGGVRNVHPYLNMALNSLGRVYDALESCRAGLRLEPENEHLVRNAALYEDHLAKMRALRSA